MQDFLLNFLMYVQIASTDIYMATQNCIQNHTCQLSEFCQETPSFDGNLPVSWFPFFIPRFLSQNNILLLF